jgi:hypothetical protein
MSLTYARECDKIFIVSERLFGWRKGAFCDGSYSRVIRQTISSTRPRVAGAARARLVFLIL